MTDTNPPELYWSESLSEEADRIVVAAGEAGDRRYFAPYLAGPPVDLPGDAVRLVPQTAAQDDRQYRITIDVPVHLADELKDSLFTAVADAVDGWEPKDREGWDPFVSGGPADHSAEAHAERLEVENERLRARVHEAVDETQRRYAEYQARCDQFDVWGKWARDWYDEMDQSRWDMESQATRLAILSLKEESEHLRAELARLREHAIQLPEDWRQQAHVVGNGAVDVEQVKRTIAWIESWRTATHPTPQVGAATGISAPETSEPRKEKQ